MVVMDVVAALDLKTSPGRLVCRVVFRATSVDDWPQPSLSSQVVRTAGVCRFPLVALESNAVLHSSMLRLVVWLTGLLIRF